MEEYDYKKEYKRLLQRKSNSTEDEKEAYKHMVASDYGKYVTVINWEKENNKIFEGSVNDIEFVSKIAGIQISNLQESEESYVKIPIDSKYNLGEYLYLKRSLIKNLE